MSLYSLYFDALDFNTENKPIHEEVLYEGQVVLLSLMDENLNIVYIVLY